MGWAARQGSEKLTSVVVFDDGAGFICSKRLFLL